MPGKVNPVLCESMMQVAARVLGNDQTVALCGAAGGQFQLNVMMPVMGDAALESVRLLANATDALAELCLKDMEPNPAACAAAVEESLSLVTALILTSARTGRRRWPRRRLPRARPSASYAERRTFSRPSNWTALDPRRMTRPRQVAGFRQERVGSVEQDRFLPSPQAGEGSGVRAV